MAKSQANETSTGEIRVATGVQSSFEAHFTEEVGFTMKLAIDGITSADLPGDYFGIDLDGAEGYEAPDPLSVCFQISMDIGPQDTDGRDEFQCIIVTEKLLPRMKTSLKCIVLKSYDLEVARFV